MSYFCHAQKLSLGFSIYKCALCMCVCMFFSLPGIRGWYCLGSVTALSFGPMIYVQRRRQWGAAELLKRGQSGVVLLKGSLF